MITGQLAFLTLALGRVLYVGVKSGSDEAIKEAIYFILLMIAVSVGGFWEWI
jgi:hypothetical protein